MKDKHGKSCRYAYVLLVVLFIILNYAIIGLGHQSTYDSETNSCTHMSSQLEGMIETVGIPVTLKAGGREDGGRHMWIKIGWLELDSVSLLPIVTMMYNQRVVEYESFGEYEKTRI